MTTTEQGDAAKNAAQSPLPVLRGLKPELSFLGIDSLYLVVEYPSSDVFDFWSRPISDFTDPQLHEGIEFEGFVLRRGAHGYKLSVWDGDARLYVTDRVEDNLVGTPGEGQGMGVMLQLGPQWLRRFGDDAVVISKKLITHIIGQLMYMKVKKPGNYPIRVNRMDITMDLVGLDVNDLEFETWRERWVGYAKPKALHYAPKTGVVEGFAVGTPHGSVRFKVYDKVSESKKRGRYGFWCSVWGLPEDEGDDDDDDVAVPVARFEWSVRPYRARFVNMRYLEDLTFEGFLALLNYVTLKWGRLCIPGNDTDHKSKWQLDPLWQLLVSFIDEWGFHYTEFAEREYVFEPDVSDTYLRYVAGVLSGLLTRLGFDEGKRGPVSMARALSLLHEAGYTMQDIQQLAEEKWPVFSRLATRSTDKQDRGKA